MTAQTVESVLPPVPHTVAGIRILLSASSRTAFDAELAAVDLDDLAAVGRFRDAWWCRAAVETDPGLLSGLDANEPLFPSPFR
jgi:hypothetical protein